MYSTSETPEIPWDYAFMDTGLLKNGNHRDVYDGKVFSTCGGSPLWIAFVWWDNSIDKRPGSNSGFYVQGFDWKDKDKAFEYACSAFPGVVKRQPVTLRLTDN